MVGLHLLQLATAATPVGDLAMLVTVEVAERKLAEPLRFKEVVPLRGGIGGECFYVDNRQSGRVTFSCVWPDGAEEPLHLVLPSLDPELRPHRVRHEGVQVMPPGDLLVASTRDEAVFFAPDGSIQRRIPGTDGAQVRLRPGKRDRLLRSDLGLCDLNGKVLVPLERTRYLRWFDDGEHFLWGTTVRRLDGSVLVDLQLPFSPVSAEVIRGTEPQQLFFESTVSQQLGRGLVLSVDDQGTATIVEEKVHFLRSPVDVARPRVPGAPDLEVVSDDRVRVSAGRRSIELERSGLGREFATGGRPHWGRIGEEPAVGFGSIVCTAGLECFRVPFNGGLRLLPDGTAWWSKASPTSGGRTLVVGRVERPVAAQPASAP